MTRNLLAFLSLIFFLFNCGHKDIKIISFKLKADKTEKPAIIEICFNKTIKRNDKLILQFDIESKTKKKFTHGWTAYGDDKPWFQIFAHSAFTQKFTSISDKDFLNNHFYNGNIQTLTVKVYSDHDLEELLFSQTYTDL